MQSTSFVSQVFTKTKRISAISRKIGSLRSMFFTANMLFVDTDITVDKEVIYKVFTVEVIHVYNIM